MLHTKTRVYILWTGVFFSFYKIHMWKQRLSESSIMRNKLLVLPQETLTLSISMKWEVWAKACLRVCFSWNPISLILYLKLLIFKILPWRLLIQGNISIEYIILFYHNFPKFFFFFHNRLSNLVSTLVCPHQNPRSHSRSFFSSV